MEFAVEAIDAKAKDHMTGGHDAMPMDGAGKMPGMHGG